MNSHEGYKKQSEMQSLQHKLDSLRGLPCF
jgi:hypothetical protein